jgi:hypothetical protein
VQVIKSNILAKDLILNTILFADEQVIVASTEDELQRAAYTLNIFLFFFSLFLFGSDLCLLQHLGLLEWRNYTPEFFCIEIIQLKLLVTSVVVAASACSSGIILPPALCGLMFVSGCHVVHWRFTDSLLSC